MALRFVNKRKLYTPPTAVIETVTPIIDKEEEKVEKPKNKKVKKEDTTMTVLEQIAAAENAAENLGQEVKVVKKDRGLIERTESSKIILTEDNRQVLND